MMITLKQIPTNKLEVMTMAVDSFLKEQSYELIKTREGASTISILKVLLPKFQNMVNRAFSPKKHTIKVYYHEANAIYKAFEYYMKVTNNTSYEHNSAHQLFLVLDQNLV